MGSRTVGRDPRRSLLVGGLIAAVVLGVLFVFLLIGVHMVFAERQDPQGLRPVGRSVAADGPRFGFGFPAARQLHS